jgi:transcriptional regulator with XRE-family HTH domain
MPKTEKAQSPHELLTERLLAALEHKGWSRWHFQREMAARGTPGSSRASIDRYLKGEVRKLPVQFLIDAAEVLEVNLLWLLGESPAMTKEDALVWEANVRKSNQKLRDLVEREVARVFPLYRRLDRAGRGAVWNAWKERVIRLNREAQVAGESRRPNVEIAANDVGRSLMAPLEAYDVDPGELFLWDLSHYVTGVCQALAFLKQRELRPALSRRQVMGDLP